VVRAVPLSWSAGDAASQHAVYLGPDRDAVAAADTSDTTGIFRTLQTTTSYTPPEGIEWAGGSYYWRIDEHNTDGTVTTGNVWSFSIPDYVLVDDFESYNDIDNLVYERYQDGFATNPQGNGSAIGYVTGESMEKTNVHGGGQSVPFIFDNTAAPMSEVTLNLTPAQDWTIHGIVTLSMWYDGDASNLTRSPWQVWNIDLTAINTNLSSVTSLAIGIQGSGATGTLLLDDIRLYAKARELVTPVQPGTAGLVAQYAFEGNANDSAGGHHGTANGGPLYALGKSGQAIALDGIDDACPERWPLPSRRLSWARPLGKGQRSGHARLGKCLRLHRPLRWRRSLRHRTGGRHRHHDSRLVRASRIRLGAGHHADRS